MVYSSPNLHRRDACYQAISTRICPCRLITATNYYFYASSPKFALSCNGCRQRPARLPEYHFHSSRAAHLRPARGGCNSPCFCPTQLVDDESSSSSVLNPVTSPDSWFSWKVPRHGCRHGTEIRYQFQISDEFWL